MKILIGDFPVLKVKDAAKHANMTVQALYISIRKNKLPYIKHDNIFYIKEETLKHLKKYSRKIF